MKLKEMKITELSESQTFAKETNKSDSSNEELITFQEVENTPFTVITHKDQGSAVFLGKFRLSHYFSEEKEAFEDAKRMDWERLIQVMGVVAEFTKTNNL